MCLRIDRLARSIEDLRALAANLTERGIRVEFAEEGLIFSGERNHVSELMLNLLGSIAQFERSLLLERQREVLLQPRRRASTGAARLSSRRRNGRS